MESEIVISNKFQIEWLDIDLIQVTYKDNEIIELEDVKQVFSIQDKMGVGIKTKRILKAGGHTSLTKEAREYAETHKIELKAEVFIIGALHQKILFNYYLKMKKNNTPTKVFSCQKKAKKWLLNF